METVDWKHEIVFIGLCAQFEESLTLGDARKVQGAFKAGMSEFSTRIYLQLMTRAHLLPKEVEVDVCNALSDWPHSPKVALYCMALLAKFRGVRTIHWAKVTFIRFIGSLWQDAVLLAAARVLIKNKAKIRRSVLLRIRTNDSELAVQLMHLL